MKLDDFDEYLIENLIEYLDLEDINILTNNKINKTITKIVENIITRKKINSPIYKRILKTKKSLEEIKNYSLIFFNTDYYKSGFKDFKKYIFHYTQNIKLKEFMLVSKMCKLLYVKEIDDNNILIIYDIDEDNIYYSILEKNIRMKFIDNTSGYIYKNGIFQENINKNVLELVK